MLPEKSRLKDIIPQQLNFITKHRNAFLGFFAFVKIF